MPFKGTRMMGRIVLTGFVFIMCFTAGIKLSSQKLLWTDELFSQRDTIDRVGFADILGARFTEGNLSPVFYISQKAVSLALQYRLPVSWKGEFCVYEPRGQIVLRLLPVFGMALSAALLFFYLWGQYSLPLACAGIALMLSGFSFWAYMPEARPYSLWMLLTLGQGIIFSGILRGGKASLSWFWAGLSFMNILLAFTIFFSAMSVIAVSAVLFFRERLRFLKYSPVITILPLMICAIYYTLAKRNYVATSDALPNVAAILYRGLSVIFSGDFKSQEGMLFTNISPYWLIFIVVSIMVIGVRYWSCHGQRAVEEVSEFSVFNGILAALGLMLVMSLMVLSWFLGWLATSHFPVAERYFVFLTPFAILLIVTGFRILLILTRDDAVLKSAVITGFAAVVVLSGTWAWIHLITWGSFWSV